MELKLALFKKTLDGFNYLANVDYKPLQNILDPRLIDGLENGLIQKFEVVTEQSWKLAKTILFQMEGIDAKTPKQCVKNFFTAGYLEEDDYLLWMQALNERNVLSHRYDEEAYQQAKKNMITYADLYLKLLGIFEMKRDNPLV